MHGPRCFLQEPPGHVHLCMGAYGEHSSRLRNFEGFKLVTNLKETKEAKCNEPVLQLCMAHKTWSNLVICSDSVIKLVSVLSGKQGWAVETTLGFNQL